MQAFVFSVFESVSRYSQSESTCFETWGECREKLAQLPHGSYDIRIASKRIFYKTPSEKNQELWHEVLYGSYSPKQRACEWSPIIKLNPEHLVRLENVQYTFREWIDLAWKSYVPPITPEYIPLVTLSEDLRDPYEYLRNEITKLLENQYHHEDIEQLIREEDVYTPLVTCLGNEYANQYETLAIKLSQLSDIFSSFRSIKVRHESKRSLENDVDRSNRDITRVNDLRKRTFQAQLAYHDELCRVVREYFRSALKQRIRGYQYSDGEWLSQREKFHN